MTPLRSNRLGETFQAAIIDRLDLRFVRRQLCGDGRRRACRPRLLLKCCHSSEMLPGGGHTGKLATVVCCTFHFSILHYRDYGRDVVGLYVDPPVDI
jgi:hypothetical protein